MSFMVPELLYVMFLNWFDLENYNFCDFYAFVYFSFNISSKQINISSKQFNISSNQFNIMSPLDWFHYSFMFKIFIFLVIIYKILIDCRVQGNKSLQTSQLLEETAGHKVETYGLPLPVIITEALTLTDSKWTVKTYLSSLPVIITETLTFTVKIYKLGPKCRWNILIVGDNTTAKIKSRRRRNFCLLLAFW